MHCPACEASETRVVDSRNAGDAVRRRRECAKCGQRFTTHERVEKRLLWVVKKDGTREPFSREKIHTGLALACRKRPVDPTLLEEAVRSVETLLEGRRQPEVSSREVGEAGLSVLRTVDPVAYIRFASVYLEFDSAEQFLDLIRPLRETVETP